MATDSKTKADKHREKARQRTRNDDASRETGRQLDDNQDDLGRDANDPGQISNDINRKDPLDD